MFDAVVMPDYANDSRPAIVPVKPGTEPFRVRARLVLLDGSEVWMPGTVVRVAADRVMVRVTVPSTRTEYVWLAESDVTPL